MKARLAAILQSSKRALAALRLNPHPSAPSESDRLTWWEKLPLALAGVSQSAVVGLWFYRYIDLGSEALNIALGIIAGVALDAIVVTTIMGRRVGRNSGWSTGASLGAFLCSALIAIDSYSGWLEGYRPLLHVSYPLMVFLYSQHLARNKRVAVQSSVTPEQPSKRPIDGTLDKAFKRLEEEGPRQALLAELLAPAPVTTNGHNPSATLASGGVPVALVATLGCPHCSTVLPSKQAKGNAARFGCSNPACPGRAKRRGSGHD